MGRRRGLEDGDGREHEGAAGDLDGREGGTPVAIAALRSEVWTASAEGTGHHAMVVGTCRTFGGYEPDVRHRSNDADVQIELVRAGAAVALLPPLALPAGDPAVAVRDLAETTLRRRLVTVTRDTPPPPALAAFLATVAQQGSSPLMRRGREA